MRVTHRMLAQSVTRNLQRNLRSLNKRSNQLSTGRVFTSPSEDPVGTYKVMKISGTGLARNEQYVRNIGEGISWLTMTDDALSEAIDSVQRLRELAVYSANGIHTEEERQAIVPEVTQLLEHLISIANTELTGLYIFGGGQTQEPPYKIAGSQGEILNSWLNENSGLVGGQSSIGIEMDNLAGGNYAVSTAVLSAEELSYDPDAGGVDATVVAEFLNGDRAGFFGTDDISISTAGSSDDLSGSLALEVVEDMRYQDLSEEQQAAITGEEDDRIIRLGARYYLYDLEGKEYEGAVGFNAGEDIYLNLNSLQTGDGQISLNINHDGTEKAINLQIATPESLTFEQDTSLEGDKLVLQLQASAPFVSDSDSDIYNRFTLHKDYGSADENGRPSTGIHLDWYFNSGALDSTLPQETNTINLKFFDIDRTTGELFTSTIAPTFSQFADADTKDVCWEADILQDGVPDGYFSERPAAVFTFLPAGEPYYVGDSTKRVVEISSQIVVPTSITGAEAFGGDELFQAVLKMENALLSNDQFALGDAVLNDLQNNLDRLLKCRSEVGARMERLLVTEDKIESEQIYLRELRSQVEDIDMAEAITEFMMQENAYQAALSTGARIIYPSLIDFLR